MARKKNKQFDSSYYAVAFIDLMGQQEQLRTLESLPDTGNTEEHEAFVQTLKNTYGAVNTMRSVFNAYFSGFEKKRTPPNGLPKEKKQLFRELVPNPIRFHQFSDFVVAFSSLRTDRGAKLPVSSIYAIIGATAATSLTSLSSGHPIRGGIDIGVGIEVKHNEIYGAALARAYALESHVANYPRVVIGKELQSYLQFLAESTEMDEVAQVSREMAKQSMEFLAVDDDGYPFIDFIGSAVQREMAKMENGTELVRRAYSFVLESSKEFQSKQNSKIAFKYTLLRRYMESRLGLWGINT